MDASFDLPDSTDWIPTSLPTFEPLEAALRCEVCKEFYTNPVITSCAHTFCSICIRRCIATDGKCPACKSACSADKLIPNIAVREVANKFQVARPKTLELARADKEELDMDGSRKKRKLSETDLQEGEPDRQTRSRQTRSSTRRAEGTDEMPIEVPDSEDDGDEDFLPDGLAKCPICQAAMKEELVFTHLDKCPGPNGSQGRNTLAKKTAFPTTLQRRHREPSPPPTRLSQLNYAMLKEASLRKKLQELRIPNWGSKDLMKRRHIEWLNIYNANCDADANMRKTKTQMLAELDEWETTQGGRAGTRESRIMRKDFNGSGHASTHRSQFDDLIANARKARATAKQETKEKKKDGPNTPDNPQEGVRATAQPAPADQAVNPARPYEGNEAALASIREKVEEANRRDLKLPSLSQEPPKMTSGSPSNAMDTPTGIPNPLGSPSRKVPMFSLPEDPIVDVENSTAVQ